MQSNPFLGLLRSRKFWLAMLDLVQVLVFYFLGDFPPEVWKSIHTVIMVVIACIAVEDFAAKIRGTHFVQKCLHD